MFFVIAIASVACVLTCFACLLVGAKYDETNERQRKEKKAHSSAPKQDDFKT